MRILHVGCGRKTLNAADLCASVGLSLNAGENVDVLHLDADERLIPDILCKLGDDEIPLDDNSVDVVIAWHVLEHIGQQGQSPDWFYAWEELYRVLTPGGVLYGECPYYTSIWAWGDPTHTREISEASFVFFSQNSYRIPESMISPYRIKCDFRASNLISGTAQGWVELPDPNQPKHSAIRFALQAQKPLRPWWED